MQFEYQDETEGKPIEKSSDTDTSVSDFASNQDPKPTSRILLSGLDTTFTLPNEFLKPLSKYVASIHTINFEKAKITGARFNRQSSFIETSSSSSKSIKFTSSGLPPEAPEDLTFDSSSGTVSWTNRPTGRTQSDISRTELIYCQMNNAKQLQSIYLNNNVNSYTFDYTNMPLPNTEFIICVRNFNEFGWGPGGILRSLAYSIDLIVHICIMLNNI